MRPTSRRVRSRLKLTAGLAVAVLGTVGSDVGGVRLAEGAPDVACNPPVPCVANNYFIQETPEGPVLVGGLLAVAQQAIQATEKVDTRNPFVPAVAARVQADRTSATSGDFGGCDDPTCQAVHMIYAPENFWWTPNSSMHIEGGGNFNDYWPDNPPDGPNDLFMVTATGEVHPTQTDTQVCIITVSWETNEAQHWVRANPLGTQTIGAPTGSFSYGGAFSFSYNGVGISANLGGTTNTYEGQVEGKLYNQNSSYVAAWEYYPNHSCTGNSIKVSGESTWDVAYGTTVTWKPQAQAWYNH